MNKKGFTLIELVIVITVTGILTSVAIPAVNNHNRSARDAKRLSNVRNFHMGVSLLDSTDEDYNLRLGDEINESFRKKAFEVSGLNEKKDKIDRNSKFTATKDSKGICAKLTVGDLVYDYPYDCAANPAPAVNYLTEEVPDYYVELESHDFTFIESELAPNEYNGVRGSYRYTGDETHVIIPKEINGDILYDYYKMFQDTNVQSVVTEDSSLVTNTSRMFYGSKAQELDLRRLDMSKIVSTTGMFAYSEAKSLNIDGWDTSNVENMGWMFSYSKFDEIDVSVLNTSNTTEMRLMFAASEASKITGLENFDTSKVISMRLMFSEAKAEELNLTSFTTGQVQDMMGMFRMSAVKSLDLSSFDVGNVIDMSRMFFDGQTTNIVGLENFNPKSAQNLYGMFYGSSIENLNLSGWDAREVLDIRYMFSEAKAHTIDLTGWQTKKLVSMSHMFYNAEATSIIGLDSLDTESVVVMEVMFHGVKADTLNLSTWDTKNVENMRMMFAYADSANIDVSGSGWTVESATDTYGMFAFTKVSTLDLRHWNTSNVTDMGLMFLNSELSSIHVRNDEEYNRYKTSGSLSNTVTRID